MVPLKTAHDSPARDSYSPAVLARMPPSLAGPDHSRPESAGPLTREMHLRAACADLEGQLCRGQFSCAEDFFAAYPLLAACEESALELIYLEYTTREELGQRPTREEYYLRFPQWRSALIHVPADAVPFLQ